MFFIPSTYIMYHVYLRKTTRSITYIGCTNLKRRIWEHKTKKPELVYYEAHKAEEDARAREMILKQRGQTVRRLRERLQYSLT